MSAGELQFTEGTMNAHTYCDRLKQSMSPSLQKLGHRAGLQHDTDPKHTSKTTTALVKVMEWTSMSADLNPLEHLWDLLKLKVEVHNVSNIHQFHDVVMEGDSVEPVKLC